MILEAMDFHNITTYQSHPHLPLLKSSSSSSPPNPFVVVVVVFLFVLFLFFVAALPQICVTWIPRHTDNFPGLGLTSGSTAFARSLTYPSVP